MRASDSPFVADWFVISLHWLVLLGLILSLSLGGQLLILPNAILIGFSGWNLTLTFLAGLFRWIGFDIASITQSYDQRGSQGMVNLRDRTELVNEVLDVQSAPGKGTRVQVFIPLTEEAAVRINRCSTKLKTPLQCH